MNEIGTLIKQLTDFGFQTVFTAGVLLFLYKYIDHKWFSEINTEKVRETNRKLNEQENEESKLKIKSVQAYLNDRSDELKAMGVDRTSVWINHNGIRNGKIHFIFYSLIAEFSAMGLQRFTDSQIGSQKLPYYIFAEYEEMILAGQGNDRRVGSAFISDQEILGHTSKAIASDLGIKSLVVAPITNLKGKIEGMVFFSSVFRQLDCKPDVDGLVNDIRAIFIS